MKRTLNAALAMMVMFALTAMVSTSAIAQQKGTGTPKGSGQFFVDQDGDGICDNIGTHQGQKNGAGSQGKGYGKKDGTGNKGAGPKDGTGYGAGNGTCTGTGAGAGVCDGTGSKGAANRGGGRGK